MQFNDLNKTNLFYAFKSVKRKPVYYYYSKYLATIGIRRPIPKALGLTRKTGAV